MWPDFYEDIIKLVMAFYKIENLSQDSEFSFAKKMMEKLIFLNKIYFNHFQWLAILNTLSELSL